MAIITELFDLNGRSFTRTYSDAHRYVVREGIEYSEATDPTEFGRVYEEGNLIEEEATDAEKLEELEHIVNILMGDEE